MTSERWQRIQDLCERLRTAPPHERADRLAALEPALDIRREALALLAAIDAEEAAQRLVADTARTAQGVKPEVGGVRLLDRIGSGGSSDVYRGVRTVNGAEQFVAVKCFHPQRARADHLDRFAREQRLLASLTHPDIVRFIDAGITGDARPYFVMELVDGVPITQYCDRQALPLRRRLRLMLSVCGALQSAHQHLIVHLDLKPSNILVTADGRAKLLDFGAAKLLNATGALTATEPLTLMYASPERLRGEAVSVAADVYGLGLILYELLSGGWPFARSASIVSVAERAVGDVDITPLPASVTDDAARARGMTSGRLRAALAGDLEAICSKALAFRPGDRYASVAELHRDLQRYLDGEPVTARPLPLVSRASRYVRRHLWAVSAGVVFVASLTGAALYSTRQALRARDAAEGANLQNRFLTTLFTLSGQDSASSAGMSVRELLTLAQARVAPDLGANRESAADVRMVLARGFISQNAYAEAAALLEQVMSDAASISSLPREAGALAMLAYVNYVQNRTELAGRQARRALGLHDEHRAQFTAAQAVSVITWAASTLSYLDPVDPSPARHFEACLDLARRWPMRILNADRAQCLQGLAVAYMNVESRYDEANTLLAEAVSLHRGDPTGAGRLAGALQIQGLVNRYRGRFADDEAAQRESLDISERLQGPDSLSALWQRAVWLTSLTGVGRAEEAYRQSAPLLAAARRLYPERGSYLLWTPLSAAMTAACMTNRLPECEALATEALLTLGPAPSDDDPRVHVARGFLGLALAARGLQAEARPLLEGALRMNASRKRTPPYLPHLRAALERASSQDAVR